MSVVGELDAYLAAVAATSRTTLMMSPGLGAENPRLAAIPDEVAAIWRWHDGTPVGTQIVPFGRMLPLAEALADGTAWLESRRSFPEHPDHRPDATWLTLVAYGGVSHVIEIHPDRPPAVLVADPSGFVSDYPAIPVDELVRVWRRTVEAGGWVLSDIGWEIHRQSYPHGIDERILLV